MWRNLVLMGVALVTASTAGAAPKPELQRDADAIVRAGAAGVLAEVRTGTHTTVVRSGPVPWNAYHRINSTTKIFTATTVLQLVGEGRLRLTDTVEQLLPGVVQGNGHDGPKITVRQLLQHTSGLPESAEELPINQARTAEGFAAAG
ncbi:serine hydrolase domain-containing protein [Paractinoplanes lichenicola]|uniref:Beta-lactamase family protein n=1 Tax=Paractinoplanes lichenicola TaxID=2802976 RepID=A0ABS1VEM3_9ACTN|nr:serine hydrolase domain-containing protein [Actinoplanes lichenicola]MBL7253132.1 beta-lactamase family protein [Actinoplanes lichenicola]